MGDYESGQWHSLNRVLNLLNTFDEVKIDKKEFYKLIMEMRPQRRGR